jgi:hypothetical protein
MKKFELNKTYYGRSICNHDSICKITVTKRTDKSVWFNLHNKIIRKKIENYEGIEFVYPHGKYSMVISADKEWTETEENDKVIYLEKYNEKKVE